MSDSRNHDRKTPKTIVAIQAMDVAPRAKQVNAPQPFAERLSGREKRSLGDIFGLQAIGVNMTRLAPNAQSALYHQHTLQEEFIYILIGEPTLITHSGEMILSPGMCAGFPPQGTAHHLLNKSDHEVVYLEVGTRTAGDTVHYPVDDLMAVNQGNGEWQFSHKDGTAYAAIT